MTSVWYVGASDVRTIRSPDWDAAGVSDLGDFTWSSLNGFSIPSAAFTISQYAYLDSLNTEFWCGAPDGPRTIVVAAPTQFVTEVQVREILAAQSGLNLTKASVGLGNVDNTSDASKPVSTAQAAAFATKVTTPAGGTDGQVLARAGFAVTWVTPSQAGGNSGSFAVTPIADASAPSGTVYRVTGSGVAATPSTDAPSGYIYSIN